MLPQSPSREPVRGIPVKLLMCEPGHLADRRISDVHPGHLAGPLPAERRTGVRIAPKRCSAPAANAQMFGSATRPARVRLRHRGGPAPRLGSRSTSGRSSSATRSPTASPAWTDWWSWAARCPPRPTTVSRPAPPRSRCWPTPYVPKSRPSGSVSARSCSPLPRGGRLPRWARTRDRVAPGEPSRGF